MRASDTVARLGGDEFTVILENLSFHETAQSVVEKIIAAIRLPFRTDNNDIQALASIGIAYFTDEDIKADALIKQAGTLYCDDPCRLHRFARACRALPSIRYKRRTIPANFLRATYPKSLDSDGMIAPFSDSAASLLGHEPALRLKADAADFTPISAALARGRDDGVGPQADSSIAT